MNDNTVTQPTADTHTCSPSSPKSLVLPSVRRKTPVASRNCSRWQPWDRYLTPTSEICDATQRNMRHAVSNNPQHAQQRGSSDDMHTFLMPEMFR
jgi:hypothetical protein